MYDLAIIGGGPAGTAAGVYASRKNLKTIVIAHEIGGQSSVSPEVQNWVGTIAISGIDLAKALKAHLKAYADEYVEVVEGVCVTKVDKAEGADEGSTNDGFTVTTDKGDSYDAKTVLVASGAYRRKLEVPGAKEYDQKGLTYCASCDGPLFTDKDVVVIGGGNAGFETAAQLLAYTKSVTLLHRSNDFKADPVTVKKVLENPKMTALTNVGITEVRGEKMVTGVTYKDKDDMMHDLAVEGVFVEIGLIPSTDYIKDIADLDDYKRIKVDARSQQTSMTGVWAAGDCTNELYHQNNIAAGDAVKALEDIYNYLHAR